MKSVAIIGATGFAQDRMIPELFESTVCSVDAMSAPKQERLRSVLGSDAAELFIDTEEMLRSRRFDAVYIATPPDRHLADVQAVTRLQTRAAILCEKPLAHTMRDASAIEKIVSAYDGDFMLGHHIRHQKAVLKLKELLASNAIGEVTHVQGEWSYDLDPSQHYADWKLDPKRSGGGNVLSDPGIHIIDLLQALHGLPLSAYAKGRTAMPGRKVYDNVSALLEYEGLDAYVRSSQTTPNAKNDLTITGTRGTIEVPDAFSQTGIERIIIRNGDAVETLTFAQESLYRNEMESLLSREPAGIPGTTLREAVDGMRILQATNQSLLSGHPHSLPPRA